MKIGFTRSHTLLAVILCLVFLKCGDSTTLLTVLGENSSNLQAMQALKANYENKEKIKIDYKPNTFEDAFNKANQDFSAKSGKYDIVLQYNFSLSNFVRNKYVYTCDELAKYIPAELKAFESDIFPSAWKEVGYYYKNPNKPLEGMLKIGYPFAANTMLLVYNKEMFASEDNKKEFKAKYGRDLSIPTSWEEYKQIAAFFTNPEKGTKGVCMQGATGGWLYYEWCQYLQGFDGKVMEKEWGWEGDETTPIHVYSPAAINATNYLLSLKPYNAGGFTNTDGNEQINIMKSGNVAMCIIWSDYMRGLLYNENEIDKRFGVATVPGKKSMLAGGSFYINKQSKHPQEAFRYVIAILQKDSQIQLMKKGLCSPLRSAYDAVELEDVPYVPVLKESLERGVYALEAGPDADMINNTITTYVQQAWDTKLTVDEALKKSQAEIVTNRVNIFRELKEQTP